MAQQKMLIGHVKGDKGDKGIDAKVTSATGTVTPGHLDEPTVSIEFGGEPGAQTATFTFAGLQGKDGAAGPKGDAGAPGKDGAAGAAGRDADIVAVNVTVEPGHSDVPTGKATVSGEAGAKTISITLSGIQGADGATGAAGPAGPAGPAGQDFKPGGTSSQVVLGDGSTKDISSLITENAEAIRNAIGLATTEHMGLVPQLPTE